MPLLQKGYLGSTPLWRDILWYQGSGGIIVDSSAATTVTANTAAHTKGAWTQVIASTTANTSYIYVNATAVSAAGVNTATLLDIATGASGSETAIVSNIAIGSANNVSISFPYKLASGTRLSARIQSVVTGGKTASVQIFTINAGDYDNSPTSVDVIGGDTATSEGIRFSGANGTWVQATASTSRAYRAVALVLSGHDATMGNITGNYSVGVGASGSEAEFGSSRHTMTANEQSGSALPYIHLFNRSIPSGSRLAVRHPITTNPERYGFNLIGIP